MEAIKRERVDEIGLDALVKADLIDSLGELSEGAGKWFSPFLKYLDWLRIAENAEACDKYNDWHGSRVIRSLGRILALTGPYPQLDEAIPVAVSNLRRHRLTSATNRF